MSLALDGGPAAARARARAAAALTATGLLWLATLLVAGASPEAVSRTTVPHHARQAYADGAPPGFTGGFKEDTCHACHFDADPNVEPGGVELAGVPDRFTPGARYPLTVTLTRPGMRLAGFQLAARFAGDGTQAGTLEQGPGEEMRLAIEQQGGVQYANQRKPGTAPVVPDAARWTVVWTAPERPAPVQFHVSANAADDDESARGDYVYFAELDSRPAPQPAEP